MIKSISLFAMLLFTWAGFAQAPFWTENFGTGCSKGTYAHGLNASGQGTWVVVSTGTNDTYANKWFISAMEAGAGIGNCGSDCSGPAGTNRSLHIGWDINFFPLLDDGAIYSAGNGFSDTDVRAESPVINCSGQSSIALSFAYLLGGIPNADFIEVHYSANGGGTWTTIATPPPTPTAQCNPQGQWTGYTVTLPPSANNNNNVKIGFRWKNTDNNGNDPSVAIDDVKLTTLTSTFAPTFSLAGPVCQGGSVSVTANTGTYVANGYTWTSQPSAQITSPNASVTGITFTSSGTYSITLTASSGGTTASSVNSIVVNPAPAMTVVSTPTALCSNGGQTATLSVSGANAYIWNPGNLTGTSIAVSPSATTIYSVTGVNNFSCTSTSTSTLVIHPTPTVITSASSSTMCSGSTVTLNASGAASYTWMPGNSNATAVAVSPSATTTYSIYGVSAEGCNGGAMITVTVLTCTGLHGTNHEKARLQIIPNPASDRIVFVNHGGPFTRCDIQITDAAGKMVLRSKAEFDAAGQSQSIQIAALPEGVYFIKVYAGEEIIVLKLVKS